MSANNFPASNHDRQSIFDEYTRALRVHMQHRIEPYSHQNDHDHVVLSIVHRQDIPPTAYRRISNHDKSNIICKMLIDCDEYGKQENPKFLQE